MRIQLSELLFKKYHWAMQPTKLLIFFYNSSKFIYIFGLYVLI